MPIGFHMTSTRRRHLHLVLVAALLGLNSKGLANQTENLAKLDLEQLMEISVESVSGVSKYAQSIRHAPASVTVLSAADIRNYGWRTLADALRTAPGFHIRNDRFYEYVGNRGFTRSYDYNSRTLVLVDGHRINDPIYQQGSVGTDFLLDPDLIERIEIIRGPGSSVYGSSAFNGAINIIPKKGRDLAGGQAAVSVDSSPGAKGRVSVGDRTVSGVEYLVSATASDSRGETNFTLPKAWRDATGSNATQSNDDDDTGQRQLYVRVAWRRLETEAAYGKRQKEILPTIYTTQLDPTATASDERAYWLLRATGEPLPDATVTAKTGVDYYGYDGIFLNEVQKDSTETKPHFDLRHPEASSLSLNHELKWHQTYIEGHSLLLGVEVQNNLRLETHNINETHPADSKTSPTESNYYFSPFGQFDYQIASPLRLSVGGRYDDYSTGEKRLSPRTGLIWDPSRSTVFKLLYGESFRVPNLDERRPSEPNAVANPALQPETNRGYELVCEHTFSPVWSADAHIYYTVTKDLITNLDLPSNTYTYFNAEDYTTLGGELGATARFGSGQQLRGSATLQQTEDTSTSSTPGDAPQLLAKLNASTPLGYRWLHASGELQYVGARHNFNPNPAGVDDYLVSNLTLRATPVWRRWEIALSVYNLANARWSDSTNTGKIVTPPRTFRLSVGCDF
jgi:outer membrane receptor for ferrienterochelin and colicins